MDLEPGTVVLVIVGGTFHCAATVIEPATMPEKPDGGFVWLDVNTLGSHLPQMYRHDEIITVTKPSDVVAHGICPSCWGTGVVERFVPEPGPGPCSACEGNGRLADMATLATMDLGCEPCNKAFTPAERR